MALYLEGSVLTLYLKIYEEDQLSMVKIEQYFSEAYMKRMNATFTNLRTIRWTREQVDE